MQYVSFRSLQNITPLILSKRLNSEGVLVVTVNNKPFAAMISLDDMNAQDTMLMVSRLRAQTATLSIRNQALKNGTNRTTLKEVNALIKKTRVEQKTR
jgi:PHD/YefM family antitoxin component YafN of YafNO toxin-antitoxin module